MTDPVEELKTLTLDVRANDPNNYILDEVIPVKDKTCKWLVTNGSPFFIKDFILKTGEGAIVNPSKYKLCGDYVPLIQLTGKRVVTFIEINDPLLLENNESFKVTYRSTGENFIPRNSIDFWLERIREGNTPLEWDNVFGKPIIYPINHHSHDVHTEIADFDDVIDFIKMVEGSRLTRSDEISGELQVTMNDAIQQLLSIRSEFMVAASDHDATLGNPHGIQPVDVDLGNVDNFKTATVEEEITGTSSTLFSTPQGAKNLILNSVSNDVSFLENGVFPVSLAGGGDYIPPNISGSFEGQGASNEASCICLEPNGRLMIVTATDDGRPTGKGLYYAYINNLEGVSTTNDLTLNYTGYKYEHPSLSSVNLNRVISSDGNKIMMVGELGTNNWYITLTNNSLDAKQHTFSKTNVSKILSGCPNHDTGGVWNESLERCSVHYAGEYIVLVVPYSNTETELRRVREIKFFRIPTSAVELGQAVAWEHFNVSGKTFENVSFSSRESLIPYTRVGPNGDDKYTSLYHKFAGGWDSDSNIMAFGLTVCSHYENGVLYMRMNSCCNYANSVNDKYRIVRPVIEVVYSMNVSTGVLSIVTRSDVITKSVHETYDEFNTSYTDDRADHYGVFYGINIDATSSSSVILPDGTTIGVSSSSQGTVPVYVYMSKPVGLNALQAIKMRGDVINNRAETMQLTTDSIPLNALPSNVLICDSRVEGQDDVFVARENITTNTHPYQFLRLNNGGYAQRTAVKYNDLTTLSRPLTNDVYKLGIGVYHPSVRYSTQGGVNSELGSDLGQNTWSGITLLKEKLLSNVWRDDNDRKYYAYDGKGTYRNRDENVDFVFPKSHSYNLRVDDAEVIIEEAYGLSEQTVNQIMDLTRTLTDNDAEGFCLFMTDNLKDSELSGNRCAIVQSTCLVSESRSESKSMIASIQFDVSRNPAGSPNTEILSNPTLTSSRTSASSVSVSSPARFSRTEHWVKPHLNMLNSDGSYACSGVGMSWDTVGSVAKITWNGFLTENGNNVETVGFGSTGWTVNPSQYILVNGKGLIPEQDYDVRCYTMDLGVVNDTEVVAGSTIFPNPLWALFFNQGIQATLNGTKYDFPTGRIDLRDVKADPSNSVFYVFMTVDENGPNYRITTNKLKQHNLLLLVAKATTNASQVTSIEKYQPCLIANRELTPERKHGAIVHSTGLPMDQGQYSVVRNSDLT